MKVKRETERVYLSIFDSTVHQSGGVVWKSLQRKRPGLLSILYLHKQSWEGGRALILAEKQ
jgi:hypothetical protein